MDAPHEPAGSSVGIEYARALRILHEVLAVRGWGFGWDAALRYARDVIAGGSLDVPRAPLEARARIVVLCDEVITGVAEVQGDPLRFVCVTVDRWAQEELLLRASRWADPLDEDRTEPR